MSVIGLFLGVTGLGGLWRERELEAELCDAEEL